MWEIAIICFVLYVLFRNIDASERRQRELKEINDRRAELEVQQRVLLAALDRLRMMK